MVFFFSCVLGSLHALAVSDAYRAHRVFSAAPFAVVLGRTMLKVEQCNRDNHQISVTSV